MLQFTVGTRLLYRYLQEGLLPTVRQNCYIVGTIPRYNCIHQGVAPTVNCRNWFSVCNLPYLQEIYSGI